MKKSIKQLLSCVLASAVILTAFPSLPVAAALTNPWSQSKEDDCSPGILGSDGKYHLSSLIIVAGFNDVKYDYNYDWSNTFWGNDENQVSLKEYYYTMSHGNFILDAVDDETSHYIKGVNDNAPDSDGDGVVHVKLNENHWNAATVSKDTVRNTISNAIQAAAPYVPFEKYDKNQSGTIDLDEMLITVLLAGYEYSTRKKSTMTDTTKMSQAHFGQLSSPVSVDGKAVNFYLTGEENLKVTANGRVVQSSIEVLAHESFHYFGLPDMYSPETSADLEWVNYRCESLSVMSRPYGVYVDPSGNPDPDLYSVYSLDPWSKIRLGWADCQVVNPPDNISADDSNIYSQTFTIDSFDFDHADQTQEIFLRINISSDSKQYFLIENRQFKGYDKGMQYDPRFIDNNSGGGIIVWHIDESILYGNDDKIPNYLQTLIVNSAEHRPAIMPVFIENNRNAEEKNYCFLGNEVNFRTGIHNAQTLDSYNLDKIDLVIYGGQTRAERQYANISVKPSASADSMSVTVNFNDKTHPQKMKQIYLEKTDGVFPKRMSGQNVGKNAYLFAFVDSKDEYYVYRDWPGVKMQRVKDNIYTAYVPENDYGTDYVPKKEYCFVFNDGEWVAAESNDLFCRDDNILYTADGWTTYEKQVYTKYRGDINLDGKVNIKDVTALQRHLAQLETESLLQQAVSDTDDNGRINITDATVIQQYLAEMLNFDHPCGKETSKIYV